MKNKYFVKNSYIYYFSKILRLYRKSLREHTTGFWYAFFSILEINLASKNLKAVQKK